MAPYELPAGACHVWLARPSAASPWLLNLLDAEERGRHARFRNGPDRSRFLAAHSLVRLLLARYCGADPANLRFAMHCGACGGAHGKPYLVDPAGDLEFSLSHAGDRVAVAVARAPVGVDVEAPYAFADWPELVPEILDAEERRALARRTVAERPAMLQRYWTCKEAILKATGIGLSVSPSDVGVSDPTGWPTLRRWPAAPPPFTAPPPFAAPTPFDAPTPSAATSAATTTVAAAATASAAAPAGAAPRATPPQVQLRYVPSGDGYMTCVAVLSPNRTRIEVRDATHLLTQAA